MKDQNEEWTQLCQQAAIEKDPEKLMRLVGRIVELLDARRGPSGRNGSNGNGKPVVPPVTPKSEFNNA